jgi:hypothetical protein
MPMNVRYNTYTFADGAASYTDDLVTEHAEALDNLGRLVKVRAKMTRRIVVDAWIQGDGAADLKQKITAFEQAFSVDGKDFIVSTTAGVEVCAVRSSDTETGIRVSARSYPDGKGIEWVNRRTVRVTLEYEIPIGDVAAGGINGATEYSQQISFTGTGGPRHYIQETMDGPPIKFQLTAATKCMCTQQGSALSRIRRLTPPAPIYPEHENVDQRQINYDNEGRVTWSYVFESVGPFA